MLDPIEGCFRLLIRCFLYSPYGKHRRNPSEPKKKKKKVKKERKEKKERRQKEEADLERAKAVENGVLPAADQSPTTTSPGDSPMNTPKI